VHGGGLPDRRVPPAWRVYQDLINTTGVHTVGSLFLVYLISRLVAHIASWEGCWRKLSWPNSWCCTWIWADWRNPRKPSGQHVFVPRFERGIPRTRGRTVAVCTAIFCSLAEIRSRIAFSSCYTATFSGMFTPRDSQPTMLQKGLRHKKGCSGGLSPRKVVAMNLKVWIGTSVLGKIRFPCWFDNSVEFEQTGEVLGKSGPFTFDSSHLNVPNKLHQVAVTSFLFGVPAADMKVESDRC
jgi:hypothetical protein